MKREFDELDRETQARIIVLENMAEANPRATKKDFEILGYDSEDIELAFKKLNRTPGVSLSECYTLIEEKLFYYLDIPSDTALLLNLWILGTHFHSLFPTYPILFLNAMRGSGKTRTLKLLSHLSQGFYGVVQNSISQSALFHSGGKPLFLDEMEKLYSKEKNDLSLLLNSVYKRGAKVTRMIKIRKDGKESFEPKEMELYFPVAMANINGVDSVLENRSLIVFLEKSFNPKITSRIEDFEYSLWEIKQRLRQISDTYDTCDANDGMTSMTRGRINEILKGWNHYLDSGVMVSQPSQPSQPSQVSLYEKIRLSNINGRTLELCFPLIIIASEVSSSVLEKALALFSTIDKRRRESELDESDVQLIRFIATRSGGEYYDLSLLLYQFRDFVKNVPLSYNNQTFSQAIDRLQLVKSRKRTSRSRLIQLDVHKAKRRIGLFDKVVV